MGAVFNGTGDWWRRGSDLPDYSASYTWSTWFKTNLQASKRTLLFMSRGQWQGDALDHLYINSNGTIGIESCTDAFGNFQFDDGGTALDDDTQNHLTLRRTGTLLEGLINGVVEVSVTMDPAGRSAVASMQVCNTGYTDSALSGIVAKQRFWQASLSDSEVVAEMESPTVVRTANLYESWPSPQGGDLPNGEVNNRDWSEPDAPSDGEDPPFVDLTTGGLVIGSSDSWIGASAVGAGDAVAGDVEVVVPAAALVTTTFAPTIAHTIIVPTNEDDGALTTFAPVLNLAIIPPTAALVTETFAPTITVPISITVPNAALVTTGFAPVLDFGIVPPTASLLTATFAPVLGLAIIPPAATLALSGFAPVLHLAIIPPTAALVLTTFAPTIDNGETIAVITEYPDPWDTVPCQRTFDARNSTFTGGDNKYTTAYEWWVYKDGAIVSAATFLRGPVFSHVFTEAGDYVVWLRIKVESDGVAGSYVTTTTSFTLNAPTYDVEYWVDATLGDDGDAGTEVAPFATLAHALTQIEANWVDAGEHCVHLKKGETFAATGTPWSSDLEGHLCVAAYGSGAKPIIDHTGAGHCFIATGPNRISFLGIEADGNRTVGTSKGGDFYQQLKDGSIAAQRATSGLIMHDCYVHHWDVVVRTAHSNFADSYVNDGASDHWAFQNCTFESLQDYVVILPPCRYVLARGCTMESANTESSSGMFRITTVFLACIANNSVPVVGVNGLWLRVHGADYNDSLVCSGVVIADNVAYGKVAFGGYASQDEQALEDFWVSSNYIDVLNCGAFPLDWISLQGECNGGVIVNNKLLHNGAGMSIERGSSPALRTGYRGDNFHIFNNTSVTPQAFTGGIRFVFHLLMPNARYKSNLAVALGSSSDAFLFGFDGTSGDSGDIIDSNRNILISGGSNWYTSALDLSPSTGTLAQWQSGTVFDDSSQRGGTHGLVDAVSPTVPGDLDLTSSSDAVGFGEDIVAAWLDYDGRIRDAGSFDAGAHELDATEVPSEPDPGGDVTITVPKATLITTSFAPRLELTVTVPKTDLVTSSFAPVVGAGIVVPRADLVTTTFAPVIGDGIVPGTASLTTVGFAPVLGLQITIPRGELLTTRFAPIVAATTDDPVKPRYQADYSQHWAQHDLQWLDVLWQEQRRRVASAAAFGTPAIETTSVPRVVYQHDFLNVVGSSSGTEIEIVRDADGRMRFYLP